MSIFLFAFTSPIWADEACGLQAANFDVIFADGFDPAATGGGIGPPSGTVSPPILGTAPTLTITFPAGGAVLIGGHTQVAGTVTGTVDTGITVNGVRAYVVNGTFLTPPMTIEDTANSLIATATTMDGLTATATRSVMAVAGLPTTTLTADAPVGFAALPIKFLVASTNTHAVQTVVVDFGDGSPTYNGSATGYLPKHTYAQPGIYTATATITFASGPPESVSTKVVAVSLPEQRTTVCSVYAYLRSQLSAAQPAAAGNALMGTLNAKLQPFYQAVGTARLPAMAAQLGTIANGMFGLDTADLVTIRDVGGQLKGYPVHFARDSHGVWRIDGM